ncbi:MAG: hypothetical protein PWQ20_1828 [Thermotogaceae bacterium]|jgi:hypothetical protein|nr:hypothetical protein [Thermotogaceae bacterium]MDN5338758.1 hypothetical protein [Thermotogaceae bacterium]
MRLYILILLLLLSISNSFATFYSLNLSNSNMAEGKFSPVYSPSGMIYQKNGTFEIGLNDEKLWLNYSDFFILDLPLTTDILSGIARKYGIDEALLKSIIRVESSFFIHAISKSNAKGLMQIKFATARENGALNSFSVFQNVEAGCKYLSRLYKEFKSWDKAIAAYCVGPGTIKRKGITKEAENYVEKVKKYWDYYQKNDKKENLRDSIWWSIGTELSLNGFENLSISLAVPILGLLDVGTSFIISKKPVLLLTPSFHLTDQFSLTLGYDFKNPMNYSVKIQPYAADYSMFISTNFYDRLSFGLMIEKKLYSILFGVDTAGVSAGFTVKLEPLELGGGFKESLNGSFIFKTTQP